MAENDRNDEVIPGRTDQLVVTLQSLTALAEKRVSHARADCSILFLAIVELLLKEIVDPVGRALYTRTVPRSVAQFVKSCAVRFYLALRKGQISTSSS